MTEKPKGQESLETNGFLSSDEQPSIEQLFQKHTRYELIDEIGRGGMGVVFRVRDRYLHRELALKVIASSRAQRTAFIDRFIEEAQISGQLQHPGIVPIYDIGRLDDTRVFFTMKYVKGDTLASLLQNRSTLDTDQTRWLTVFQQVCQAVAFSHSRNVIHRDLKPSNIMVGRFGETQVMDWGLAKVVSPAKSTSQGDATSGAPNSTPPESGLSQFETSLSNAISSEESIIRTIRHATDENDGGESNNLDTSSSLTEDGHVLGTVAYMPSEQAMGSNGAVNFRSDVFALGGILVEIVTNFPPYVNASTQERHWMALRAELTPCFKRLDESPYDESIKALIRDCLSANPDDRPADASVVAERINQYLASLRNRLHRVEIEQASTQARLDEAVHTRDSENRRRRMALLATFFAIALLATIAGALFWLQLKEDRIRFAKSETEILALQHEREISKRLEQDRQAFDQFHLPAIALIHQIEDAPTPPSKGDLRRLLSLVNQAKDSIQPFSIGSTERDQYAAMMGRSYYLQELFEWIEQLDTVSWNVGSVPAGTATVTKEKIIAFESVFSQHGIEYERIASDVVADIAKMPAWAKDEIIVAIHQLDVALKRSTTDLTSKRNEFWNELSKQTINSPSDELLWNAILNADSKQLISLTNDDSLKVLTEPAKIAIAEALSEIGPSDYAADLDNNLPWKILRPAIVTGSQSSQAEILEDGSVRFTGTVKSTEKYIFVASIPPDNIRWIRFETMLESDSDNCPSRAGLFLKEAIPFNDIRISGAKHGELGLVQRQSLIEDFRWYRKQPSTGEKLQMNVAGMTSGHRVIPGNELHLASDYRAHTFWSVEHLSLQPRAASFFEFFPQFSSDRFQEWVCEIQTGDPYLQVPSLLGRFRLSYCTQQDREMKDPRKVALGLLENLYDKNPKVPRLLVRLAQLQTKSTQLGEEAALAFISSAISLDPNDLRALDLMAWIILQRQPAISDPWYRRLIGHLERIRDLDPKSGLNQRIVDYQLRRGDEYYQSNPEISLEAFQEAMRLTPDSFDQYGRLAWSTYSRYLENRVDRKSDLQEAERLFKIGTEKAPHVKNNWYLYSRFLEKTSRHSQAIEAIAKVLEIDPDDGHTRRQYTNYFGRLGRYQDASESLGFLAIRGELNDYTISASAMFFANGKQDDFVKHWFQVWCDPSRRAFDRQLADDEPFELGRGWYMMGLAMMKVNAKEDYRRALEKVLLERPWLLDEIRSFLDSMLMRRRFVYEQIENPELGIQLANEIVILQPTSAVWKVRQASMALAMADFVEAQRIANAAKEIETQANACLVETLEKVCQVKLDPAILTQKTKASFPTDRIQKLPACDRDFAEWLWWEFCDAHPTSDFYWKPYSRK